MIPLSRRPRVVAAFFAPLLSLVGLAIASSASAAPKYESGTLTVTQAAASTWHTFTFARPFVAAPVVVLGTPTHNEADALSVRVRNVTTTGFQYQLDEWEYLNGTHASESLSYLALEPGTHTIGTSTWRAGRTAAVARAITNVTFSSTFTASPIVLAQVETAANAKALSSRVSGVTTSGFQIRTITQEADTATLSGESVGWVAISPGSSTIDGGPFVAAKTGTNVTQDWKTIAFGATYRTPLFFSQAQTVNGSDPFTIRRRNLTANGVEIFLQEDQSAGTEVNHGAEDVGYLVLAETAGELRAKLAFGSVTQAQASASTWHTETLDHTYTNPVVVFGPTTQNDAYPVGIRVRNVTSTTFEWQFDEWDYQDGAHGSETAHYVVAEEGSYLIAGRFWQFGRSTGVTHTPVVKNYAETFAFGEVPVVFSQVTTRNGAAAVSPRLSNISSSGFTVELDEEEAADQTHVAETVHYLALQKGQGSLVSSPIAIHAGQSAATIHHVFQPVTFSRKLANAFLIADTQTKNDADAIVLRQRLLGIGGVELRTQEEISLNPDTSHSNESVAFLAVASTVDSDGDGLPDEWELAHGLNPNNPADALLDPDGDGPNTLAEYNAETNPLALDTAGTITVTTESLDAFEKNATTARIRVDRTGGIAPVTVQFTLSGNATKPGLAGADYATKNTAGTVINGSISLAANQTSAVVHFEPVLDTADEYPETATLTITPNAAYTVGSNNNASVKINDAADTPANEQLFVAFLTRQGTAQTYASGVATVYLNGPKNRARVNLSFSGLTSNQSNAYLRYGVTSGVGPELRPTLPIGQVNNEIWTINPAGAVTGQNIIDGLFQTGGKWVYLNIGTGSYPAGEIAGTFSRQTGSSNFTAPPAAPPIATLTGDALTRDVARFLTQATFGPTKAEIDALVTSITTTHGGDRIAGYSAWIDTQFNRDQTKLLDYVIAADSHEWSARGAARNNYTNNNQVRYHNRRRGWWLLAAQAHDQLRQRVGFALSEILVVSDELTSVRNRHEGLANYYDQLAQRADGNYRTLLGDVSKSPIMGKYLSHLQNQKTVVDGNGNVLISPDENYAREILQLFSIGLVHLHPDGSLKLGSDGLPIATYKNDDITSLARVFTGWSFSKRHGGAGAGYPIQDNSTFLQGDGPLYYQTSWTNPLKNFAAFHDTGAKTVLGSNIAAGLNGQDDLAAALDIIFAHPNVAPFVSRRLIQRLVTSNPSQGYLYRVAQKFENNGSGARGNLKAVVKAILLDYEARTPELATNVGFGKQKEPIIRYVQLIRALGGKSNLPLTALSSFGYPAAQLDNFPAGTTLYRYPETENQLGQVPQGAPSVFNWFLPDYNPGGPLAAAGLVAPEIQLSTETSVVRTINYHYTLTNVNNGQNVNRLVESTDELEENVKLSRLVYEQLYDAQITGGSTAAQATTAVLDQLDLLLTSGNLKQRYGSAAAPNPRSIIIDNVATLPAGTTTEARVKEILYLLVSSPEYINQR